MASGTNVAWVPAVAAALPPASSPVPVPGVAPSVPSPWSSPRQPAELWQALQGRRALAAQRFAGGNDVRMLLEYPQVMPQLFTDVARARRVIDIVEYNWEPNGVGSQMAELLKQKAREGVEVNVVTDANGSFGLDSSVPKATAQAMFADMASAGVHVKVNPVGFHLNPLHMSLDHRKLFVVDGQTSYVGGLGLARKYETWHDMMLRVQGPAAAQAQAEFVARWVDLGGTASDTQRAVFAHALTEPTRAGSAQVRFLPNSPGVHEQASHDFFAQAAGAQHRFWTYTPYIGDQQICDALIAAARRGVDVRVMLPSPESHQNGPLLLISRTFYRQLIDNGVHVYEFPRMTHAKAWIADDTVAIGSTNLSDGSFRWYSELSASVRDAALSARMTAQFFLDEQHAAEVTHATLDTRRNRALTFARTHTGFSF